MSRSEPSSDAEVQTHILEDDGVFPNNGRLPLIVYLGAGPLSRLPRQRKLGAFDQGLLLCGGIRGAVAIALALSLSVEIPDWYTIQSMVYGVALFSLVFQAPLFAELARRRSS